VDRVKGVSLVSAHGAHDRDDAVVFEEAEGWEGGDAGSSGAQAGLGVLQSDPQR
jgi:hypothetical protein